MRKHTTMNLDLDLLEAAQKVLGTSGATETVHRALAEVVRRARIEALLDCAATGLTPASLDAVRQTRTFPVPAQSGVE